LIKNYGLNQTEFFLERIFEEIESLKRYLRYLGYLIFGIEKNFEG
jgi:hypothetical protein